MTQIPLNLVAELLLTHMAAVMTPGSKDAFCEAFECAARVWPHYCYDLMMFGPGPSDAVEQDAKYHCLMIMHGFKYGMSRGAMATLGMTLVEQLWIDTGLSVDDFCARIEQPGTSELVDALREFLQTRELAAADKRQVH